MAENRIVITADDDDIIKFDDITSDSVSRTEVAAVLEEIEKHEAEKTALLGKVEEIDVTVAGLKKKIAYALAVIEVADKLKAEKEAESVAEDAAEDTDTADEIESAEDVPVVPEQVTILNK